jgi:hypothetical protein
MAAPTLPLSRRDVHPVVPQGYDREDATAPCYLVRTPTMHDRARIERSVTTLGARNVSFLDVLAALREAARAALDVTAADAAVALIDEYEALLGDLSKERQTATTAAAAGDEAAPASTPPTEAPEGLPTPEDPRVVRLREVTREVDRIETALIPQVSAYAETLAARDYWWTIYRTEVARHLLKGWTNVAVPYERDRMGVLSIDALSALDPGHVFEVSLVAVGLLTVSPAQRGN